MPTDKKPPEGHENASGVVQKESARTVSDSSFPKARQYGEFGTHGGPGDTTERDPKKPGVQEK